MAAERLPGPHSGVKTTVAPGDPLSRSMGHYGKGHDPMAAAAANSAGLPSVINEKPPGAAVRGGAGGFKTHPKFGAMGAGPMDSYGQDSRMYGSSGDQS